MKLFLSSMAISAEQAEAFNRLFSKKPEDIKLALIENAADVYDDNSTDWVDENRAAIQARGYQVEIIDLRDYRSKSGELREKLSEKDAIWLGGGNTCYLRWILKDTGTDKIVTDLIQSGVVYGGGSAGAIVAGPTLKHFEDADDPSDSPEVILDGLRLTETAVIPHAGNEKYGEVMDRIEPLLQSEGFTTAAITDEQAWVFDEGKEQVIG